MSCSMVAGILPSGGRIDRTMSINLETVLASMAASGVSVAVLLRLFWDTLSERMLAGLKAKHAKELESLKQQHAQLLAGYQHELDKTILVTKVHFETEFAALKESFEKLAQVRLRMASIRPFMGLTFKGETHEDKLKALFERLGALSEAYNGLIFTTENLSPFFPREIYHYIDECRQAAQKEILDVQTGGDDTFSSDWYAEGEKNRTRFMQAYATVSGLIRDHIAKLAIARAS